MAQTPGHSAEDETSAPQGVGLDSFQSWLAIHGNSEYALYKKEAAAPQLTYEDWASSEHPLGPYLYHLTLEAWGEESSSDEELEDLVQLDAAPVQRRDEPVEAVALNLNGMSDSLRSSKAVSSKSVEETDEPLKKRQRKRKSFPSEPIVPPEDDLDTPSQVKPDTTAKKGNRNRKSQPTSPLPPEEIAQSTPIAVATTPDVATDSPDTESNLSATRRGLRTRTPAQQRPYFHHAKLFEEQIDKVVLMENTNKHIPTAKSKFTQTSSAFSEDVSENEMNGETEKPLSGQKKFKGVGRAWKKDNEDQDGDYSHVSTSKQPKKIGRPRKVQPPPTQPTHQVSAKAEEGDENEASSRTSQTERFSKVQRKPRKSHLSEEFVRSESDSDAKEQDEKVNEVIVPKIVVQGEKPTRRPRKSYLSQEIIENSSSTEEERDDRKTEPASHLKTPPKVEQKRRRRSKKSYLSEEIVRDDTTDSNAEHEEVSVDSLITPVKEPKGEELPKVTEGTNENRSEDELPDSARSKTKRGRPKKAVESSPRAATQRKKNGEVEARDEQPAPTTPLRKTRKSQPSSLTSASS